MLLSRLLIETFYAYTLLRIFGIQSRTLHLPAGAEEERCTDVRPYALP